LAIDKSLVSGIIWDLDNTLYRFTDDFLKSCTKAAAKAAQELGINLSYEDTLKLAERSEIEHGYSMHGYVTDHGLSYASLHFPFHENIDETVIEPIKGISLYLNRLSLPQVILTNASRDWANRALKHVKLDDLFDDSLIIPMEDINFKPKARTDKGFKMAAKKLALPWEEILMVDDLDRNLIIPSQLGMQCAYMHHGDPMEDLPDFVDDQFKNPTELIKYLLA
jgi:FMN phosphatase YigB (HAD superfamily)